LAGSFFKRHAITAATAALTDCQHMVSGTLSLPSRGTFHHSLTVLSAIGHQEVFSLTRWSWQIHTKFHEFRATRAHAHCDHAHVSPTGLSPTPVLFPTRLDYTDPTPAQSCLTGPCTPHSASSATPSRLTLIGFRLLRVRSPLLPESLLFSLPAGTVMFHFPAFPPRTLYIQARVTTLTSGGVSPFGHPRINARLSAPEAYRRFPRPSSAPDAKASPMRSHPLTTP